MNCEGTKEFLEDLAKAQLAKKLIKKFTAGQEINLRLLLNHIIMFTNVFEMPAAKALLMHTCVDYQSSVKTMLLYLNYLGPGEFRGIKHDLAMAKALKELK